MFLMFLMFEFKFIHTFLTHVYCTNKHSKSDAVSQDNKAASRVNKVAFSNVREESK